MLLAKCAEQLESSERVCACLAHTNYTVPLVIVHFRIELVVFEQLEGSEQVCVCLAHNSTVPLLFVSLVGLFIVCFVGVSVVGGLLLSSSFS